MPRTVSASDSSGPNSVPERSALLRRFTEDLPSQDRQSLAAVGFSVADQSSWRWRRVSPSGVSTSSRSGFCLGKLVRAITIDSDDW